MKKVSRFDLARFSPKTSLTPQGFLKAPAHFTRAGVFIYRRADGTTVRELRPADEVFSEGSMASLAGAPVVIDHPAEGWVNPRNATKLAKGWVGEKVARADTHLTGALTIMDQDTIDRAGKDLKEISLGYRCRIDSTSGVDPEFGRYDQIQRDIRYNHCALGPEGWGRAGSEIGLRLDAEAAILDPTLTVDQDPTDTGRASESTRKDHSRGTTMDTEKVTINGVEFEIPKSAAQAYKVEQKRQDSAQAEFDKLQGRFDAQTEKLTETEKALKEATDPERFDSAVDARVALLGQAKKVLGDEAEVKGTKREIMEQTLRHDNKDRSFEGKSDDYVESRFDALLEGWDEKRAEDTKLKARCDAHVSKAGQPGDKQKDDRFDSNAARQRMLDRHRDAWKNPEVDQK